MSIWKCLLTLLTCEGFGQTDVLISYAPDNIAVVHVQGERAVMVF